MTMHKRVHTGERPLVCDFPGCGKRFSESSNLSKHRKSKSPRSYILYLSRAFIFILFCPVLLHWLTFLFFICFTAHNPVGQHRCSFPGCGRSFHRLGMSFIFL